MELLTILKLITIRNSSDVVHRCQQYQKDSLSKFLLFFDTSLRKFNSIQLLSVYFLNIRISQLTKRI